MPFGHRLASARKRPGRLFLPGEDPAGGSTGLEGSPVVFSFPTRLFRLDSEQGTRGGRIP